MSKLEETITALEKKIKKMSYAVITLSALFIISVLSNFLSVEVSNANAQSGYVIAQPEVPLVIEAQSFILKDKDGNIRGMWSAEDDSTTFATAHKQKQPFISMNIDEDAATLTLSDNLNNQIFLTSSNSNGQSMAMGNILNPSHNILLGFNENETNFELISANSTRIGMSGQNILIEALGTTSDLVIAEREGNYINLSANNKESKVAFVDSNDYENLKIEYKNGRSIIYLNSPATKTKAIIDTSNEKTKK